MSRRPLSLRVHSSSRLRDDAEILLRDQVRYAHRVRDSRGFCAINLNMESCWLIEARLDASDYSVTKSACSSKARVWRAMCLRQHHTNSVHFSHEAGGIVLPPLSEFFQRVLPAGRRISQERLGQLEDTLPARLHFLIIDMRRSGPALSNIHAHKANDLLSWPRPPHEYCRSC